MSCLLRNSLPVALTDAQHRLVVLLHVKVSCGSHVLRLDPARYSWARLRMCYGSTLQ